MVSGLGATRYVNLNNPTPVAPFTSWATAATKIQDAVNAAQAGETVLVTNGVYATGGWVDETSVTNRVAITRPLLVQSVNGPSLTVIRGDRANDPYPGVRCAYLADGAVLSGFTLTNGMATNGGGAWCASMNAVITNCFLIGNRANFGGRGGGAYGGTLDNCNLSLNSHQSGLGQGGGAYAADLKNCTVFGNTSRGGGGVAFCTVSNSMIMSNSVGVLDQGGGAYRSILYNCYLIGNCACGAHALGGGAAVSTLNNCVLRGNYAVDMGGGGVSSCTLSNCTLVENSPPGAAGSALNNCIFYYNSGDGYNSTLNYCCTSYLPSKGIGNFTNEPAFIDLAGGDLGLRPGSPCIDSGQNLYASSALDLDGHPRIANGTVDVGAYEFVDSIYVLAAGITNRFETPPYRSEWSTFSVPGTGISGDSDAFIDSWMTTNGVANITNALEIKATNGLNPLAYWNSTDKRLVTQPTGNNGTLLMARLKNSAGYTISDLTVAYTMAASIGTSDGDPIFGHRLYFSETGANNTWHPGIIPNQTLITGGVSNNPAIKTFTLNNLSWAPRTLLFLIWADDNGHANPDADFSIDNISFIPTPPPRLMSSLVATQIELAWPQTAADFILEATPDLGSTTTWTTVTTTPASDSGFFHLRLPAQPANQFFRLRRP
jgi:hypothetical protein